MSTFDDDGAACLAAQGAEIFGCVPSTIAWSRTWGRASVAADYQSPSGYRSNVAGVLDDLGTVALGGADIPGRVFQGVAKTPAQVQSRLDLVDARVQSLNADIQRNVVRPDFLSSWGSFKANWQDFNTKNHSDAVLLATGTLTVDRQIDGFEHDLAGWQDALLREAPQGQFSTPAITSTQTGQLPTAPSGKTTSGLPWWAISMLTVGGILGVAYLGYLGYTAVTAPQRAREGAEGFMSAWGFPGNRTHPLHYGHAAHDLPYGRYGYDASGDW